MKKIALLLIVLIAVALYSCGKSKAKTDRNDGEINLLGVRPRLVDAVHHLVDAAIAAQHHQMAYPVFTQLFGNRPSSHG